MLQSYFCKLVDPLHTHPQEPSWYEMVNSVLDRSFGPAFRYVDIDINFIEMN